MQYDDPNALSLLIPLVKVLSVGAFIISMLSMSFVSRKLMLSASAMEDPFAEAFFRPLLVLFFWTALMLANLAFVASIEQLVAVATSTAWNDPALVGLAVLSTAGAMFAGYWEARILRASFFVLQCPHENGDTPNLFPGG